MQVPFSELTPQKPWIGSRTDPGPPREANLELQLRRKSASGVPVWVWGRAKREVVEIRIVSIEGTIGWRRKGAKFYKISQVWERCPTVFGIADCGGLRRLNQNNDIPSSELAHLKFVTRCPFQRDELDATRCAVRFRASGSSHKDPLNRLSAYGGFERGSDRFAEALHVVVVFCFHHNAG